MSPITFQHVDVFAERPFSGNGLSVFCQAKEWPTELMQALTVEMRQYESIFLSEPVNGRVQARIFTMEEELPFAGHPVLGAAAVLHRTYTPEATERTWILALGSRDVHVATRKTERGHHATMSQGQAELGPPIDGERLHDVLATSGLRSADLVPSLPACVGSTGLPYLILPVTREALSRIRITGAQLQAQLAPLGAMFLLFLDPLHLEQRTWDNDGRVEDIATGSAAGPAGAYLHRFVAAKDRYLLQQGRFLGRSSSLEVRFGQDAEVLVSGHVVHMAHGAFQLPAP